MKNTISFMIMLINSEKIKKKLTFTNSVQYLLTLFVKSRQKSLRAFIQKSKAIRQLSAFEQLFQTILREYSGVYTGI